MMRFKSSVLSFLGNTAKVTTVTFLTLNYLGGFVVCYGPSMEPTLKTRDVLLTDHISPRLKKIEVGDVVVAKSPDDYRYVCKRVVAGPGDIVLFKNNTFTIPEEFVWLEGDNKENSNDSRFYGAVPYSMIRRRCFCKIWPQIDLDLDASEKYYLEAEPTSYQKAVHRYKEKQRQLLQQQTQGSTGKDTKNGTLDTTNHDNDGPLSLIKANTAERIGYVERDKTSLQEQLDISQAKQQPNTVS